MAQIGKALLVFITVVLLVVSTASAIDFLLIDDAKGVELVDRQACELSRGYYTANELECDGFVIWLIYFVPLWFMVAPVWLFFLVEPGWQKPRRFHGPFAREAMIRGALYRR